MGKSNTPRTNKKRTSLNKEHTATICEKCHPCMGREDFAFFTPIRYVVGLCQAPTNQVIASYTPSFISMSSIKYYLLSDILSCFSGF